MKYIFMTMLLVGSDLLLAHPGHVVSEPLNHPFWHAFNGMDYIILVVILLFGLLVKYNKHQK